MAIIMAAMFGTGAAHGAQGGSRAAVCRADPTTRAPVVTIDAVGRWLAELENLFNTVRWR